MSYELKKVWELYFWASAVIFVFVFMFLSGLVFGGSVKGVMNFIMKFYILVVFSFAISNALLSGAAMNSTVFASGTTGVIIVSLLISINVDSLLPAMGWYALVTFLGFFYVYLHNDCDIKRSVIFGIILTEALITFIMTKFLALLFVK